MMEFMPATVSRVLSDLSNGPSIFHGVFLYHLQFGCAPISQDSILTSTSLFQDNYRAHTGTRLVWHPLPTLPAGLDGGQH